MGPVYLIGYMCSGKTTLGEAVARAIGVSFIDLDDEVEAMAGMSVKEIFAKQGEATFRELEMQALRQASGQEAVIACGGGTPCRAGAMEVINASGTSVYLRPSMDRLVNRLMEGRAKRPLLAGISSPEEMREFAQSMINSREKHYLQAKYTFDSSFLENEEEISQSVNKFIKEIWDPTHPRQ